jgi:hypothetical protein
MAARQGERFHIISPFATELGEPAYLLPEEARLADALHHAVLNRPWDYWLKKHA